MRIRVFYEACRLNHTTEVTIVWAMSQMVVILAATVDTFVRVLAFVFLKPFAALYEHRFVQSCPLEALIRHVIDVHLQELIVHCLCFLKRERSIVEINVCRASSVDYSLFVLHSRLENWCHNLVVKDADGLLAGLKRRIKLVSNLA